jgi:hypothetical protein
MHREHRKRERLLAEHGMLNLSQIREASLSWAYLKGSRIRHSKPQRKSKRKQTFMVASSMLTPD